MSKKSQTIQSVAAVAAVVATVPGFSQPKSIRDAGLMFDRLNGDTDSLKAWAASGGITGYPDNVPDELRDEFKVGLLAGYVGRAPKLQAYLLSGNDTYTAHNGGAVPDKASVYQPKLEWVASLKSNDLKAMKTNQPGLYSIVEPVYRKAKTAVDTAWHRFLKYMPDGQARAPSTPDLFAVWIGKVTETMLKRVKTAEKRGDASLDPVKVNKAIADFRTAIRGAIKTA